MLVVATDVLDDRCRYLLEELARNQRAANREALGRIVEHARRLRDSWWPELVLVATGQSFEVVENMRVVPVGRREARARAPTGLRARRCYRVFSNRCAAATMRAE